MLSQGEHEVDAKWVQMPQIWQVWRVLPQEDSGAKELHLLPTWAQTHRVWILQAATLTVQPCTQVLACSTAPFSVVPCPDCCCLEHMNWAGSALLWYSYSSSSAAASHFIGDLPFCFQLQDSVIHKRNVLWKIIFLINSLQNLSQKNLLALR